MAKKNTIKKSTKVNKNKFSLMKLDFKKNWKKLSYLGLAGFLAVSSIGYGLWKVTVINNAKALSSVSDGTKFYNRSSSLTICQYASKTGTTTLKVKAIKINSGFETFSIDTNGTDFFWSSKTSGSNSGNIYLNNVGTASWLNFRIAVANGPATAGNYGVQYLAGCKS